MPEHDLKTFLSRMLVDYGIPIFDQKEIPNAICGGKDSVKAIFNFGGNFRGWGRLFLETQKTISIYEMAEKVYDTREKKTNALKRT